MLHMPSPMLIVGPQGPSYAEFQAQVALLTSSVRDWVNPVTTSSPSLFRTTATSASLTGLDMLGSTWGPSSANGFQRGTAPVARAIQHGLPSQAAFNAQIAGGFDIFFEVDVRSAHSLFQSVTRNGYTSDSLAGSFAVPGIMTRLIYWDGERAQEMNPSTGTGPTPYIW